MRELFLFFNCLFVCFITSYYFAIYKYCNKILMYKARKPRQANKAYLKDYLKDYFAIYKYCKKILMYKARKLRQANKAYVKDYLKDKDLTKE